MDPILDAHFGAVAYELQELSYYQLSAADDTFDMLLKLSFYLHGIGFISSVNEGSMMAVVWILLEKSMDMVFFSISRCVQDGVVFCL